MMLKYIPQPSLTIANHTIYAFGTLLMIGIYSMFVLTLQEVNRRKLPKNIAYAHLFIGLFMAFPLSHMLDLLIWHYDRFVQNPWLLLNMNAGMCSFAGILSWLVLVGIYHYVTDTKAAFLKQLDCSTYGFCFGWIICRIGCAFAHDHPSVLVSENSWLAIDYPTSFLGGGLDII